MTAPMCSRVATQIGTRVLPKKLRRNNISSRCDRATTTMAIATLETPSAVQENYEKVLKKLKELSALEAIDGLMAWDEMVMMPSGAAACRGAQKAALAGVLHDKKTDAVLGELLKALYTASDVATGTAADLDAAAQANIRDAYMSYRRAAAIPKDLEQRIAKLSTESYAAWVEARSKSDFSIFAPFLQQRIDCCKEKARHIDPQADPYDVLMHEFEKGMKSERLDAVFKEVKDGLVPLIAAIKAKGADTVNDDCVKGKFDKDKQAELCRQVALDMGFDLEKGRLDVSVHPFTMGTHPTDVRITTRFKEEDVLEGITATIHETGHALYEQGRNLEHDGLPVSMALSMGVHESQSLLWERMVGLSKPFCNFLLPKLQEYFPGAFSAVTAEQLYAAMNKVMDPSFIRFESDELSYPMHIIVRYEIERGLISGTIQVEDVPKVWNAKMKEYLGAEPPNDAKGCLQDMHWAIGAIGYFPTYSLGAMYATQIYQCAKADIPDLEDSISKGEFKALLTWLNDKIHKLGSLHPSGDDLMTAVTGGPLQPSIFLEHVNKKYKELYQL